MLFDAHGEVAQDFVVVSETAFHFRHCGGRRVEAEHHIVRALTFLYRKREVSQSPQFVTDHGAAVLFNQFAV